MSVARMSEQQLAEYEARQKVARAAHSEGLHFGDARFWPIIPTPAPRQVRKDAWHPSSSVIRYREFRDEVARQRVWGPRDGDLVVFLIRIPASWSLEKKLEMDGYPHQSKPDFDNLLKALLDACYGNDAHIWTLTPAKFWSSTPGIYIERRTPSVRCPFLVPAGMRS